MDKKRNCADDDDIRPYWHKLRPPKHVKRERSEAEDTKNPAHKSTLEQLNKPVIKQGRIYPERLEEGTARILVLHPGSASDDIKCDLRQKVPLAQALGEVLSYLPYEALSYVWGGEDNPDSIVLCKSPFAVTRNLAEALKHLRLPSSDRMLWADAICINQFDIDEKEAQVKSMHWIYRLAERVIAWLGPSDDDSSLAYLPMDFIQKQNVTPVSTVMVYRVSNEETRNEYDPFTKLMERPYWFRAWIVQEMMFARFLVIQCGSEVVPYSTLEKVYPRDKQAYIGICSDESDPMRIHFLGDPETGNAAKDMTTSWCPYLGMPYECCSIEPQDKPSLFAEKAIPSFLTNDRLRVKGFVIGKVSRTISRYTPPRVGATAGWDQANINRERKHYWKCLTLGLNGMPKDKHTWLMSIEATTRTLFAGRGGEISDVQTLVESRTVGIEGPQATALRKIGNNGNSRLVCSFQLGRAATRALYSSNKAPAAWINRIALVPRTVRRGDAICTILGCPVPVVLRRMGKRYHVLGEAYVDTSAMGRFRVAVGLKDFILE